jgi:hypothetical protein
MDSGQLLNRTLANRLICQTQQIAKGPTGPTGPDGTTNIVPGAVKGVTIYLDYSALNAISRVYIPPGFFTTAAYPGLSAGGVFTSNQGSDLVFLGSQTLVMNNTTNGFCTGILVSGYVNKSPTTGEWNPVPGGNIGNTQIHYSQPFDNAITLKGLSLTSINGSSLTPRPSGGAAAGFLATITLFYV